MMRPWPTARATFMGALCRGLAFLAAGGLCACVSPPQIADPSLAQFRIVDLPPLDAAQLPQPALALLVDVAPEVENAALVAPRDLAQYRRHACRTAERFIRGLASDVAVRIQPFQTRTSDTPPCSVQIANRPGVSIADDVWEVDAPATAFLRWAEDPQRTERRVQLVLSLEPPMVAELCQLTEPWVAEGLWIESIRLDGGPALRNCLAEAPSAPASHVQSLLEAAAPPGRPFRLMRPGPGGELSTLFRGTTTNQVLEVQPGLVIVVLEGNTEEELGPFKLRPGTLTTLRTIPVPEAGIYGPEQEQAARHWWEIEQTSALR